MRILSRCSLILILAAFFLIPESDCRAQKFKLPNLLPFKNKSREVKPFELSDGTRKNAKSENKKQRQLFDFLDKQQKSKNQASNSKNNGQKGGKKGFNRFAADTRALFNKAMNPPKSNRAWWNNGPTELKPDDPLFKWANQLRKQTVQPAKPLQPSPRTARGPQAGEPRHRF